jgi:hypothetical protein
VRHHDDHRGVEPFDDASHDEVVDVGVEGRAGDDLAVRVLAIELLAQELRVGRPLGAHDRRVAEPDDQRPLPERVASSNTCAKYHRYW